VLKTRPSPICREFKWRLKHGLTAHYRIGEGLPTIRESRPQELVEPTNDRAGRNRSGLCLGQPYRGNSARRSTSSEASLMRSSSTLLDRWTPCLRIPARRAQDSLAEIPFRHFAASPRDCLGSG
jgi:hypothetical protein